MTRMSDATGGAKAAVIIPEIFRVDVLLGKSYPLARQNSRKKDR